MRVFVVREPAWNSKARTMTVFLGNTEPIARLRSSSPPIAFDIDGNSVQLRFSLPGGVKPTDVLIETPSPAVVIRVMADASTSSLGGSIRVLRGEIPLVLAYTTEHESIQNALDDVSEPIPPAASTSRAHQLYYAGLIALGLLIGFLLQNIVVIVGAVLLAMTASVVWVYNKKTREPEAVQYLDLDDPEDLADSTAEA
jgi:hypothetical protein